MNRNRLLLLAALGLLSIILYAYAFQLQDLRAHTVEFEFVFFTAFLIYAVAVVLVLRQTESDSHSTIGNRQSAIIFSFALLFNAILVFTPPTLSDDMYRYVWDGRVQANGVSPYAYPPIASELAPLRDSAVWSHINRNDAITVYPAGAELAYAAIWRIVPDNVRWFQIVMAVGNILAGLLLVRLLRALDKPTRWVLIFLWNPLVIFETAHAAHVDGLVLPLIVGAWLARVKGRDGWTGALLGLATALKFYPALLLPALWRWRDNNRRLSAAWVMPFAFAAIFAATYIPYLGLGARALGYLPNYFDERFNMGLAGVITYVVENPPVPFIAAFGTWTGSPQRVVNLLLLAVLGFIMLAFLVRPAHNAEDAIRCCIFPIGAFTLLTQNLFPWYLLWLIPLLAIFLQPGKLGLRFDAWTAWFLFSGLIELAYTFFITWTPVTWALYAEYIPLYAILVLSTFRIAIAPLIPTFSPVERRGFPLPLPGRERDEG